MEDEYQKNLREQISAGLERKAAEKVQQQERDQKVVEMYDFSDVPFDGPYIIRKKRRQ